MAEAQSLRRDSLDPTWVDSLNTRKIADALVDAVTDAIHPVALGNPQRLGLKSAIRSWLEEMSFDEDETRLLAAIGAAMECNPPLAKMKARA